MKLMSPESTLRIVRFRLVLFLTATSLAIPVITRTMADFLGFGDRIRSISNTKALYSENEIYQHITNCQIFLTYNADETKLLKRRAAFKSSLQYLLELTESGSVRDANRWTMTQMFMGISHSDDAPASFMRTLGLQIAERILKQEPDPGKAAAILLLTALDVVYNAVLAVCSSAHPDSCI